VRDACRLKTGKAKQGDDEFDEFHVGVTVS
jgi:hypothetical protein